MKVGKQWGGGEAGGRFSSGPGRPGQSAVVQVLTTQGRWHPGVGAARKQEAPSIPQLRRRSAGGGSALSVPCTPGVPRACCWLLWAIPGWCSSRGLDELWTGNQDIWLLPSLTSGFWQSMAPFGPWFPHLYRKEFGLISD